MTATICHYPTQIFEKKIRKVIEEESIADSKNVTVDTFSNASNTQIENSNVIFASENIDKLDMLVDSVKIFTINDAEYY